MDISVFAYFLAYMLELGIHSVTETKKQNNQEAVGTVVEILPNFLFKVRVDGTDEEIFAYLSGRMRINRIKILVGDRVSLVLDSYGDRSRINRRL